MEASVSLVSLSFPKLERVIHLFVNTIIQCFAFQRSTSGHEFGGQASFTVSHAYCVSTDKKKEMLFSPQRILIIHWSDVWQPTRIERIETN